MPSLEPVQLSKPLFGDLIPASGAMACISSELAKIVAATVYDYPLVQFLDEEGEPEIVWMYKDLVIEIFVAKNTEPTIRRFENGGIEVEVSSIQEGMRLMRHAEAILQGRTRPYINLA